MNKVINLKGEERLGRGKGSARSIRRDNMIPATIYGGGKDQVMFSMSEKEITMEYRRKGFMTHLIDLEIGKAKYKVLPKQVQLHPVTDEIIHLDFMHVGEHDKIKVVVPLNLLNKEKCLGVKQGGALNVVKHDVELLCLASAIPGNIDIDVVDLQIGTSFHVSDIKVSENVEILTDGSLTIVTVTSQKKEAAEEGKSA